MSTKTYDEAVTVTPEVDLLLKRTFVNHLLIYNHCLQLLYKDPETPFRTLKRYAAEYIKANNFSSLMESALYNEIYYQFKKFNRNIKVQKHLNDIQYFTFTVGSYVNKDFVLDENLNQLRLNGIPGIVSLNKPLPDLGSEACVIYVNLSYSNKENAYRLNMYRT